MLVAQIQYFNFDHDGQTDYIDFFSWSNIIKYY